MQDKAHEEPIQSKLVDLLQKHTNYDILNARNNMWVYLCNETINEIYVQLKFSTYKISIISCRTKTHLPSIFFSNKGLIK